MSAQSAAAPARWAAILRRRLARRPDSEHEMSLNRIVIVSAIFAYLMLSHAMGFVEATAALVYGQLVCFAYFAVSLLIFGHILMRPGVSHARRHIALLIDMTALSAGMHIGDSALGLGYPIYLWIIFGNGFRFGVEYLKRATVLAVVGFGFMALHTPVWIRDRDLAVGLLIGLIALPVYVSVLIRKLSEAKQQAEEASKAKSMFLASVSHELRTPLNAIISFGDLLRLGRLDREQAEMATVIGDSGRSLLGLINNILDFSRIEAGKQPIRIAPFDLAACLDQVRRVLSVQAQAKGVFVHVWIGPGLPLRLIGPEQEFKQVLLNLGGNAVKFTSRGGVTICVRKAEGPDGGLMLKVDVIDTGIGIATEAQGRIFDAFAQADDSIIDSYGGTGLGLAIVRQLVRRHGGEVSLASEPGKGSTFSFSMGVSEAPVEADVSARRAAVIVSHHPALGVQFSRFGARPDWVTNVSAARDALAAGVDSEHTPLLVFDRETMSEAAFGNMAAVLDEMHVSVAVGVMSETPDDHERTAGFPLTISMGARATEEDWRRLAAVGEIFVPGMSVAGGVAEARMRSLRILVAEDNRTNQEVARRLLERGGHQVDIATQGEEAVEMLERQTFDLVLMDINMPIMNGYEATKLHRFASLGRRHVPIYALTADVTPETRERSREAGMQGCLHKPIDMAELQSVLDAVGRSSGPGDSSIAAPAPALSAGVPTLGAADDPPVFESVELVDAAALRGLAELGGASFVSDLTAQFIADAWRKIDELDHAAALQDAASFRDVTHSLRSSAANLGARRLFAMCLEWRALGVEDLAAHGAERITALRATLLETEAELTAAAALLVMQSQAKRA